MPKIKSRESEFAHIPANIMYYAKLYDYKVEDLAEAMHCSRTKWFNRNKNPENFTVGELQRLANNFNVSIGALIMKGAK